MTPTDHVNNNSTQSHTKPHVSVSLMTEVTAEGERARQTAEREEALALQHIALRTDADHAPDSITRTTGEIESVYVG